MIKAFFQRIWAAMDAGADEAFEREREENRAAMRALLIEKFNLLKDGEMLPILDVRLSEK